LASDTAVSYAWLALYGIIASAVGQIGDLTFSYIKRRYGIKDFGNLLPGHGGILDRFDSLVFVAPLTEAILMFVPFFK
ncbi:MAG: phosphatidate cytidylyltransferase, partial [Oscillospiraceae bacterium]|nr:phosphatidate cytidylyltransferase [Oscillospiraceae bacterium]